MATAFLSVQEAARVGVGGVPPRKLRASEFGGRLSALRFRAVLPAAGLAIGDTIQLCHVPADVSVLGGLFVWDRSRGAASTAIGVEDEPDKYHAAVVTASGVAVRFAESPQQHHGAATTAEEVLIATNAGAPWVRGAIVTGYITFIGA